MQRTVRVLRIALPIAFVAFVILIVLSWNRRATIRRSPDTHPVTSTQRPDDAALAEARAFRDVQTIGGRVASEIVAARVVSFESGWMTLEGVRLTLYRQNGLTYVISCPQAQFNSQTKEAEAKGGVQVSSSDGVSIRTAEIRYDGARLTNDIPVEFTVDRWNGKAGALDLDVQGETLRLHKRVDATMAPAHPAELPMTLAGTESIFRRRDNTVEFRDKVHMTRGPESLRSDWMISRFSQDRKQIVGLEGSGNCVVVMAANTMPGEDLGGRKEISSDHFHTEIGPDGQINAFNFNAAANPVRAILDGPPKRDITARGFRVALANKAVSEIKADWQVVMKELLGAEQRQINAEHVTVWFNATNRRPQTAYLEGAFRYSDPRTTASAFRANYDIAGDRIILTTDPGWQATVVSEGHTLKAKQIEFAPRAQTAKASGTVIAQLVSRSKGAGPAADGTSVFPAGAPVFVNADELFLRQAQKSAVFTGNVRAWQENNTIFASELNVMGSGDTISARGNVRTVLYNTAGEAQKTPMQSTSDQLIARRAEKRVELIGNVSLQDETRNLKAETATLFLDDHRKVQRVEAEKNVVVVERATQRKGSGEKIVYHVDKKMIYVFGAPAVMSDPSGSLSGEQIVFDLARDRVQVLSAEGQTKGTYKHEG